MTRMTREFSLLLLGSGMLTTGYFLWPEQDYEKRSEEQAQQRVGGPIRSGSHVMFIGHYGGATSVGSGRAPVMTGAQRAGLGSTGFRVGGGS